LDGHLIESHAFHWVSVETYSYEAPFETGCRSIKEARAARVTHSDLMERYVGRSVKAHGLTQAIGICLDRLEGMNFTPWPDQSRGQETHIADVSADIPKHISRLEKPSHDPSYPRIVGTAPVILFRLWLDHEADTSCWSGENADGQRPTRQCAINQRAQDSKHLVHRTIIAAQ
jgi:hypothetical protein